VWRRSKPGVLCFAGLIPVVTVFSPAAVTAATLEPGTSKAGSGFLLEHHDPFVFYSTSVESLLLNF
jgi:hypothetical protein